jgi:hypothetical protein
VTGHVAVPVIGQGAVSGHGRRVRTSLDVPFGAEQPGDVPGGHVGLHRPADRVRHPAHGHHQERGVPVEGHHLPDAQPPGQHQVRGQRYHAHEQAEAQLKQVGQHPGGAHREHRHAPPGQRGLVPGDQTGVDGRSDHTRSHA